MDFKSLVSCCTLFGVLTVTSGLREMSCDMSRRMDDTFFMSKEFSARYRQTIIDNRDGDVITPWTEGEIVSNETHACPWSYVLVYNKNRTPNTHLEVICLTPRCVSFSKQEHIPNGRSLKSNQTVTCQPAGYCSKVFAPKRVKVQQKTAAGQDKCVWRILMVSVACTCSKEMTPLRKPGRRP